MNETCFKIVSIQAEACLAMKKAHNVLKKHCVNIIKV